MTLHLREVEDTGQVERIAHIQVYPEQRLVAHGIEGAIKLLIVFVLQFHEFARPQRSVFIDDVILVGLHLLAVFSFLLLAEDYGKGEEITIFNQQRRNARFCLEHIRIIFCTCGENVGKIRAKEKS